jgi:tol-pal system protein YbgF
VLCALICAVVFAASSCATKKDFAQMRADLQARDDRADSRLRTVERTTTAIDSLLSEQNNLLRSTRALLGTQGMEQQDNLSLLEARLEELNVQLQQLQETLEMIQLYGGVTKQPEDTPEPPPLQTVPTIKPSSGAATPAISGQEQDAAAQKLYDTALEDINNERYLLAESRLLSFLMQYPDNALAGNAQYWIGEASYAQDKYELAITEFEKVVSKFNKSPKVTAALLKIGFSQIRLEKGEDGKATLLKLIKDHPDSEEAARARTELGLE